MNQLHKPFLFFVFLCFNGVLFGQYFPEKDYPQDYFIYPVKGVRISLSANFGELRSNHYHMGLDCRTDQAENKTTVAAADGYVSRISVAPFGYGRAIYINHPNGFTTVYGHVNKFYPELENYLKEKQYEKESWAISLELAPDQFPVKKGQFIALSGNTGGSAGPHVHFEIRDTKTEKVLNPLLFNMPVPDKVPPTIVGLYMYDRCKSTYNQVPVRIPLKWAGNKFVSVENVITIPTYKVSFGITANDKQSGSNNPNGIYSGVLYVDNVAQNAFQLDNISYDETRYLNAHIDYKTRAAGGPYIQHFSRLAGYPEGVYKDILNDGVIELEDQEIRPVKLEVADANGNKTYIEFNIKRGFIKETGKSEEEADGKDFLPLFVNVYEDNDIQLYLDDKALYDSVRFTLKKQNSTSANAVSPVFSVLSGLVPVETAFTIRLKADKEITDSDKVLIKRSWKGKSEVLKAKREGEWFTGRFKTFGDFELIVDNEAPVITGGFLNNSNLAGRQSITFTPKDNNNQIKNFRAELNGKWLMFTNDKGRNFIYHFDENCPKGKNELKITVEDEAGNTAEKILHFTR